MSLLVSYRVTEKTAVGELNCNPAREADFEFIIYLFANLRTETTILLNHQRPSFIPGGMSEQGSLFLRRRDDGRDLSAEASLRNGELPSKSPLVIVKEVGFKY